MNVSRASGDTEGLEKFRAVTEKIQVIMDVFLQENPEMIDMIIDLHIGDPFTEIGLTGVRSISQHSISIEFTEEVGHNG